MVSTDILQCPYCANHTFGKRDENLVCASCGKSASLKGEKIFFSEFPQNAAVNPVAEPRDKRRWTPLRLAQHKFIASVVEPIPSALQLCDLGRGPGQLGDLYDKFTQVVGIDFYPYGGGDIVTDLEKSLPVRDSVFDVVSSTNTFEHIHQVQGLVKECLRVLRHGGILMGSTPFLLGIHQAPYDFHRFTRYELEKLLGEAGFVEIKIVSLASAYDWYRTSELHFFMKLFDAARALRSWPKSFLALVAVKMVWNLQKYFTKTMRPLFSLSKDTDHVLGYGFTAKKQ